MEQKTHNRTDTPTPKAGGSSVRVRFHLPNSARSLVASLYLVIYMPGDTNAQNAINDLTINAIQNAGVTAKNDTDIEMQQNKKGKKVPQSNRININIIKISKSSLYITCPSVPLWERSSKTKIKKIKIMGIEDFIVPGVSVIGEGINAAVQSAQNRKARRFQREMFDKTNEYNTPLNQVKRMKEGGLNPALMYGSGAGSAISSSKADQPSAPQTQAYQIPPNLLGQVLVSLSQAQLNNSAKDLNDTKKENIESNTWLTNNKALQTAEATKLIQQEYRMNTHLWDTSVEAKQEGLKKLRLENQELRIKIDKYPEQLQSAINNLNQDTLNKIATGQGITYDNLRKQVENTLIQNGVNPNATGEVSTVLRLIITNLSRLFN